MDTDQLMALAPRFHEDGQGGTTSWGLPGDALQFISETVEPGQTTLETGTGMSTVVFLDRGARHTTVCRRAVEVDRVRAFCKEHGVSLDRLVALIGRSEWELPHLPAETFDVFLIDGRHGFPTPFIDWFYGSAALKTQGVVIVDDTQLWSGHLLCDFLRHDPRWETIAELSKTAAFRKLTADVHEGEWTSQPHFLALQEALDASRS